jgi:hypothetical protein
MELLPDDMPQEVRQLVGRLADVVRGQRGRVAGPAVALIFSLVIAELGDGDLARICRSVGKIASRHGAFQRRRPH